MKKLLIAAALLFLAACAGLPDDASPREKALALMARYEVAQTAAEVAVTSPLIAAQPKVKDAIKSATKVATTAVLAYVQAAKGCVRQPDGSLAAASGLECHPDAARLLLPTATASLTALAGELVRLGYLKEE